MRNVMTLGIFLVFWFTAIMFCNLASVFVGLWGGTTIKIVPYVGFAIALALTVYVRRKPSR